MKPSVLVALLVGGVLGFALGHATTMPTTGVAQNGPPNVAARPNGPAPDATVYKVPLGNAPIEGSANAQVTIVEFSDYQCPFCGRGNATIEQLQKEYGDKLRLVMKQFPLSFHPHAHVEALAALAAGEQGKYWPMHHLLFDNQPALAGVPNEQLPEKLQAYAEQIGLNIPKWKEDQKSEKLEQLISHDTAEGQALGVNGTPAFFINGRKLVGAQPIDQFRAVIDDELRKLSPFAGQTADQIYARLMNSARNAPPPSAPPAPPAGPKHVTYPKDAPFFGPKNSKVTIVEWSDFQCPFCGRVFDTVEQIRKTYPKDVKFVFRNEPLPFHQFARPAAMAAWAAHLQGKFWPYHDQLFTHQQALDQASLEKYAQDLGLNMVKFKKDMASKAVNDRIEQDATDARTFGANGTPNFFINGVQVVGAQPFAAFKQTIDEQIARADKLLKSGVKMDQLYDKLTETGGTLAAAGGAQAGAPAEVKIGNAPAIGPKSAPVTIVEWSDFQCPFCGRAFQTVKQLEEKYKGKIRVVFKENPLSFHEHARDAALAALAANEQGKFWQYHDLLFTHQDALDRASLEKYAEQVGLNMTKFKAALDSHKYDAQIASDLAEGGRLGVQGTPAFFINGQELQGAQPIGTFEAMIDAQLQKK